MYIIYIYTRFSPILHGTVCAYGGKLKKKFEHYKILKSLKYFSNQKMINQSPPLRKGRMRKKKKKKQNISPSKTLQQKPDSVVICNKQMLNS